MKTMLASLVALLLIASPAMAQTAISGSGSSSTSNANAHSSSSSDSFANLDFAATIDVSQGGTTLNESDVPSIAWGSVALSGLANGEGCVLSKTQSFNAQIAVAGFGGGAGYGNGETVPYDICNDFKSLVVLQALDPSSMVCETVNPNQNCHTAGQVAGRIVAHLPGVPAALEELSGEKPAQQSYVQDTKPAAQTAAVPTGTACDPTWSFVQKQQHGCAGS